MIKSYPAPKTDPVVIARITDLARTGISQQEVIWEMRRSGLHIIPAIKLSVDIWNLSHPEAKELVHFSEAWADLRPEYDHFHETMFDAAKQAGFEEVTADSLSTAS